MSPDEMRACITYANGIDPRVQMTAPNAQLWGRVLADKQAIEVTTATLVYYERPHPGGRERPPIDPAAIKKIIYEETNRQTAVSTAKAALPPARNPNSYRSSDPERWDRMVARGREQYRSDLRNRGITPHHETCPSCRPRQGSETA